MHFRDKGQIKHQWLEIAQLKSKVKAEGRAGHLKKAADFKNARYNIAK
jgi:hypothetical protein